MRREVVPARGDERGEQATRRTRDGLAGAAAPGRGRRRRDERLFLVVVSRVFRRRLSRLLRLRGVGGVQRVPQRAPREPTRGRSRSRSFRFRIHRRRPFARDERAFVLLGVPRVPRGARGGGGDGVGARRDGILVVRPIAQRRRRADARLGVGLGLGLGIPLVALAEARRSKIPNRGATARFLGVRGVRLGARGVETGHLRLKRVPAQSEEQQRDPGVDVGHVHVRPGRFLEAFDQHIERALLFELRVHAETLAQGVHLIAHRLRIWVGERVVSRVVQAVVVRDSEVLLARVDADDALRQLREQRVDLLRAPRRERRRHGADVARVRATLEGSSSFSNKPEKLLKDSAVPCPAHGRFGIRESSLFALPGRFGRTDKTDDVDTCCRLFERRICARRRAQWAVARKRWGTIWTPRSSAPCALTCSWTR